MRYKDKISHILDQYTTILETNFVRMFQKSAKIVAIVSILVVTTSSISYSFFFGPKIDPRWKELVSQLEEYLTYTHVKQDPVKARKSLETLNDYDIKESDFKPLHHINRFLIPKGMFLMYFYTEPNNKIPVIKLFNIAKLDVFNGFDVEGKKRRNLFGRTLEDYNRVLLGEEIFSTEDVPPVALPYNLAVKGSAKPDWVIAIPYEWILDLYGSRASGIGERLVEELTIHEIVHIMYETEDELLPFLAQFGYRLDAEHPLNSLDDLVDYLKTKPHTYESTEYLMLERIYYADTYYGKSSNSAHLNALRYIKDALVNLTDEINRKDPKYPRSVLKISDQQCYASMALIFSRALQRLAMVKRIAGKPFM